MSQLFVDTIKNTSGGALGLPSGAVVTGVVTATSFSGNLAGDGSGLSGIVTGITAGDNISVSGSTGNVTITGLANTANVSADTLVVTGVSTLGAITGTTGSFSGSVSVGGTLTYQDVTNIDSVGVVTARSGIVVTSGGVNIVGGGITATGVGTFHSGLNTQDVLAEEVNVTSGKLSDNTNIDLENGMVHLFTTTETTTSTPNIRYNASTSLDSRMSIGQSIVVTLITTAAAAAYSANITIDGSAVTENWIGGSAPSDGGSSGVDIHTFTIIKTASATFTVIGNQVKTS